MNVSLFRGAVPASSDSDRRIHSGPLYPTADVLQLLKDGGSQSIQVWTRKCIADTQRLALDADDLVDLLREAVSGNDFRGSEWCLQTPRGPWAACDAYALFRREWMPAAHKEMTVEYYLKFAIGKTGKILLFASCHLREERRSP